MKDRALGSTIRLKFTTTDSNGAPVAPSSAFVASDFRIYKDGSATEKTSTNGITVTSPFDSVVGRHLIEIDTSNATGDVGFWASGSAYFVELNTAKTVNSQTVSGLEIGSFSIELQTADTRKFSGSAVIQSGGRPEVKVDNIAANAVTASALATDAVAEIADAVWDEPYADHNAAGSFGKLMNTIRKSNLAIDGTVTNAITPTTLTFSSNVVATTSAYAHAVLLFTTGPLAGENSPIISYNSTNGVFVLEEPLTAAPSNGDEFVVIAASHVHAVSDIQSGLATLANQTTILDRQGYTLAVLAGACADPQTSAETYAITLSSSTYTVDMAGQTSIGARTAPTLTKT